MLCHYAKCHYAECRILFIVVLSVIMLSVVPPNKLDKQLEKALSMRVLLAVPYLTIPIIYTSKMFLTMEQRIFV
jgi:hypothetical protein